jgi:hypothetical protein
MCKSRIQAREVDFSHVCNYLLEGRNAETGSRCSHALFPNRRSAADSQLNANRRLTWVQVGCRLQHTTDCRVLLIGQTKPDTASAKLHIEFKSVTIPSVNQSISSCSQLANFGGVFESELSGKSFSCFGGKSATPYEAAKKAHQDEMFVMAESASLYDGCLRQRKGRFAGTANFSSPHWVRYSGLAHFDHLIWPT